MWASPSGSQSHESEMQVAFPHLSQPELLRNLILRAPHWCSKANDLVSRCTALSVSVHPYYVKWPGQKFDSHFSGKAAWG